MTTESLPVSQRERAPLPARTVDPGEHARIVAALAIALTRLEQTTRRLAFATSLKDDRHQVAANDDFLKRIRGWFQA